MKSFFTASSRSSARIPGAAFRLHARPLYQAAFFALWLLVFCGGAGTARAVLQFDVFLGYDGIVPQASWFPVVCEVKNDGPSFTATVEIEGGNQGQTRRIVVELPTGTLKRFVIPVFSTSSGYNTYNSWSARLLDEHGRVRAEQTSLNPRKQIARGTPLIGALSRTAGGTPQIRPILSQETSLQPVTARLLPPIFPDNPLVLEGLDCLYLNSERAADLKVNQVNAIFAWLNAGGHLIVAVEQPSDITSSPWLKNLFPCELKDLRAVPRHPELQDWLRNASWTTNATYSFKYRRNQSGRPRSTQELEAAASSPFKDLPNDFDFETAPLQAAAGEVRAGNVVVAAGDTPLIVTANRGRGRITALLFSPEREPMRSWKNLPTFWAKLAEVPGELYTSSDFNPQGGWSSDGIFGAMIDSRQVHKLPVEWLLLLLVVYLVVIGPLDQYWLKRIGKPMLTWITFPCYVVLFSLVIYYIGYKLRAGESEWNELHVVDVLPSGERAELRGRTYLSVYSPANQKYLLESQQKYATLRGDFAGAWSGARSDEKADIMQDGDGFKAEIFVPVWTSQLFVNDWWQPAAAPPLTVTVRPEGDGWQVRIDNRTERKLTNLQIAIEDRMIPLAGEVPARETKTFTVSRTRGMPVIGFVTTHGSAFQNAVQSRQQAFGQSGSAHLDDLPNATMAASFLEQLSPQQHYMNNFIAPPGLDMSSVLEHGSAVLLAWAEDFSPAKSMYHFSPRRSARHTLWRIAVEAK